MYMQLVGWLVSTCAFGNQNCILSPLMLPVWLQHMHADNTDTMMKQQHAVAAAAVVSVTLLSLVMKNNKMNTRLILFKR